MLLLILKRLLLSLAILVLTMTSVWAGKIYKWVDKQGVTQFSTFPPLVQKADQPVTTVKGLSTPGGSGRLSKEDLYGVWFIIENRKKHTLTFSKDSFVYRLQESKTAWGLASSGKWRLDGGILELNYTRHKDKNKQGTKEQFFVKKADQYSLTLIAKQGSQHFNFRKDTNWVKSMLTA